jgi:hypothetical protein
MALCRCDACGVDESKSKKDYVAFVNPVGYPNTAMICGKTNCTNPAKVWLDEGEFADYQNGVRIFRGSTSVAGFCVV